MPAAAAKERKAPDSAGLGYSVSGRARPPSASVPRPGRLPRAAQNNWEEALAGCGDDCWVFPLVLSGFCEEYVAVSGVRVVSPSLPFGPHK